MPDLPDMLPSAAVRVRDADAVTRTYRHPTTVRPCPGEDDATEFRERDGLRLVVRNGIVLDVVSTSEQNTGQAAWNHVPTQRTGPRVRGTRGARRLPATWAQLWARLKEEGVTVDPSPRTHYKCRIPGRTETVTVPVSASDHRALANTALQFQRAGVDLRR